MADFTCRDRPAACPHRLTLQKAENGICLLKQFPASQERSIFLKNRRTSKSIPAKTAFHVRCAAMTGAGCAAASHPLNRIAASAFPEQRKAHKIKKRAFEALFDFYILIFCNYC